MQLVPDLIAPPRSTDPSLPPREEAIFWLVDGQIQEQTRYGKVVWTWNTKDHIPIADSARWLSFMDQAGLDDGTKVWDLVHLNTIDPHGKHIVISLRHADAVYEIDKQSGRVLWKLGGRHTSKSLRVVGDPLASESFGGQHDPSGADTAAGFHYEFHCDGSAFGPADYATADPASIHACTARARSSCVTGSCGIFSDVAHATSWPARLLPCVPRIFRVSKLTLPGGQPK